MNSTYQSHQRMLSAAEAARLLRCSVCHIRELAREDLIPAWRAPNGQWRFCRESLIEMVARGSDKPYGI